MSEKATVASDWLAGCAGCHMSLLDMDERLVTLLAGGDLTPRRSPTSSSRPNPAWTSASSKAR